MSSDLESSENLPTWKRKIIHVDMDAFFAAIEQRDNPDLQGKPVIVGGTPDSRGVVATCSYEARKFGVHSAMPSATAKKKCRQAIFVRPNFEKYKQVSKIVMGILKQHTDLVESVSLDEAYLDVTKHKLGIEDPVAVVKLIRQNIQAATSLTASAGVAPNFFIAKIASDFQKPDGLTVVTQNQVLDFLSPLSVRKIPGVGPVTESHLKRFHIETCGDLRGLEKIFLIQEFGKTGVFLYERARGRDKRVVEPYTQSKQYSSEETFSKDITDLEMLKDQVRMFSQEVMAALRKKKRMGKTITVKVKYHDFSQITRSKTLRNFPTTWEEVYRIACDLLEFKTEAGKKPVRLVGLGISNLDSWNEKRKQEAVDTLQPQLWS